MSRWETSGVEGLEQMEKAIAQLPDRLVKKHLRAANRSSANIIRKEAKRLAQQRTKRKTNRLVGGFAQRQKTYNKTRIQTVIQARAPHAHLLEFGTAPRYHKNGKYVGAGPALRFMTDAYEDNKVTAAYHFQALAIKGLNAEVAALGKKKR